MYLLQSEQEEMVQTVELRYVDQVAMEEGEEAVDCTEEREDRVLTINKEWVGVALLLLLILPCTRPLNAWMAI
jgi:hypothetical protein